MKIALVLPIRNEAETLPSLLATLRKVCDVPGYDFEWIFVDDGSTDDSARLLLMESMVDERVRVITFTRNFGHQAAVTAGLDYADADAVIVMDADLQDPPDLIWDMVALWRQGFDIVSPQRISREGETAFKRWTASAFYALMRHAVDPRLKPQVSDFRLYSRVAVHGMRQLREQHRFLRGMAAWLGLREAVVPFRRAPRRAGATKYSTRKMLSFAWTAVSSFSVLPLRGAMVLGALVSAGGVIYGIYTIYVRFLTGGYVPGWASLASLQIVFSGVSLLCMGLIGDYVGRIYEESKGRPLYLVRGLVNLSPAERPRAAVLTESCVEAATRDRSRIDIGATADSSRNRNGFL